MHLARGRQQRYHPDQPEERSAGQGHKAVRRSRLMDVMFRTFQHDRSATSGTDTGTSVTERDRHQETEKTGLEQADEPLGPDVVKSSKNNACF